jgi:hypothetical protein
MTKSAFDELSLRDLRLPQMLLRGCTSASTAMPRIAGCAR